MEKLIRSIAYKMTGSYSSSEDIYQDIQLKILANKTVIKDEKNYIIRMTVNHCLNLLEKESKTTYPGIWLPEPIPDDLNDQFISEYETSDYLTYELMRLLHNVSPSERAVFILKEAFDLSHQEIADALDIQVENSRQLLKRAKEHIRETKHNKGDFSAQLILAQQYVQLIHEGDVDRLITLLNEDIVAMGDGGGKSFAAKIPIVGNKKVALFLRNIAANAPMELAVEFGQILGQLAIFIYNQNQCITVQILSIEDGKITQICSQTNPDKLTLFHKK